MTQEPLVSICITSFNYERYVGQTVEAAINQTYPRTEIIVVDDGSSDRSVDVIRKFGPKVKLIEQRNAGCAAARNTCIRNATGDLFAFCDSDDWWRPNKLEKQVPVFVNHPQMGLVHSGSRCFDSETNETLYEARPVERVDYHDMLEWCQFGLSSSVFSRAAIERAGLFDETLRGTDDWDIGIRVAFDFEVLCVRELLVEYRMHSRNATLKSDSIFRNSIAVVRKQRQLHPNCDRCIQAIRNAERNVRKGFYAAAIARAHEASARGNWLDHARWRMRGMYEYPSAMSDMIRRRIFGNPQRAK